MVCRAQRIILRKTDAATHTPATGGAAVVCGSPHQFFSKRYAAPCIPSIQLVSVPSKWPLIGAGLGERVAGESETVLAERVLVLQSGLTQLQLEQRWAEEAVRLYLVTDFGKIEQQPNWSNVQTGGAPSTWANSSSHWFLIGWGSTFLAEPGWTGPYRKADRELNGNCCRRKNTFELNGVDERNTSWASRSTDGRRKNTTKNTATIILLSQ